MADAPIFCKFAHHATLHAEGDRIRIYWAADQGYSCGSGTDDISLGDRMPVLAAVNVDELVCHVMTATGVFEVNARHGLQIRKIGPTLSRQRRAAA